LADKILTEVDEFTYSIGCSKRKGRDHSINLAQPGSICDMLPQQSRTMDDPGDLGNELQATHTCFNDYIIKALESCSSHPGDSAGEG
jgi:hypothetical protein